MTEFFFTFAIFALVVAGMAIGVFRGRAPLTGSCGGLNQMGADGACEICGGRPEACTASTEKSQATRLMR